MRTATQDSSPTLLELAGLSLMLASMILGAAIFTIVVIASYLFVRRQKKMADRELSDRLFPYLVFLDGQREVNENWKNLIQ